MIKKIAAASIVGIVIIVSLAVAFSTEMEPQPEPQPESNAVSSHSMQGVIQPDVMTGGDVIMPTKVSRPGCEETDRCYIPSVITISAGESVTWVNEDSAFHSVTSGFYDAPQDLFDSGHMDPFDSYTLTFDEPGTIDYYCTLHPWMEGQVIVE
ncbi:cupredoxin domain-containing protein [Nitrosopumilus maritimus]|uniref:Blue (Type 1) copper domain protein n=1 Tax=Nitrosopumilus maritimus (strain SCM1) TaxID=436308 RepID=A9A3S7_NITMS|nr:plastocyanin/azurin family copper-binding protein [Nitrosopumilus maritimus]ABX13339.1 blue (type 1) copper domain protein [Nitrosopumilus maritimus SCM1]